MLDTALCDKVCQRLAAGQWFSTGTPVSFTNKTDCHDITEILLKVALNTSTLTLELTGYQIKSVKQPNEWGSNSCLTKRNNISAVS